MDEAASTIITVTLNPAVDRAMRVENLHLGEHAVGQTISRSAGGKGVNVSRVLAAMDLASTAMGFLGRDNTQAFAGLFESGLIRDGFLRTPGTTRENITLIDAASGRDTHIRDAGLAPPKTVIRELGEQLVATVESGDVVIFAGSLPPGVDAETFADLLKIAVDAEANVAVDTSGEGLAGAAKTNLWLIKPNVVELEQIVGRPLPDLDAQLKAARGLAQKHDHVLLSRGPEGAVLITRDGAIAARCTIENAVNTVGCGDVLLAAFVATALTGGDATDALATAVAAAAASASTDRPATFNPETLEQLIPTVEIETLEAEKTKEKRQEV